MKVNELEEAWGLLEEALKENKATYIANGSAKNGETEDITGKRKLDTESCNKIEKSDAYEPLQKKLKTSCVPEEVEAKQSQNGKSEVDDASEKFSWSCTIRNILTSKCNEIKLKKLKKKVLKRYQALTGSEWSLLEDSKFNKKLKKLCEIDNEKVRLIA